MIEIETMNILSINLNNQLIARGYIALDEFSQTAFKSTFLGGLPSQSKSRVLVGPNSEFIGKNYDFKCIFFMSYFSGCMQDIIVNGIKVTEKTINTTGIVEENTEVGCTRTYQCNPNPCQNNGQCIDLWRTKKCLCDRPYFGSTCQYSYTEATFGYENTTDSQVIVTIDNPKDYLKGIDLSMFIMTHQSTGFLFYIGKNEPNSTIKNHIIGKLVNGKLQVSANTLNEPIFKALTAHDLSNGDRHFIRVTRMKNEIAISVNNSLSIYQELSSAVPIQAEKMYLGNLLLDMPDETSQNQQDKQFFKGVIQDVQLSDGYSNFEKMLNFYEPEYSEELKIESSIGDVATHQILPGKVSDNTCKGNPCKNSGV